MYCTSRYQDIHGSQEPLRQNLRSPVAIPPMHPQYNSVWPQLPLTSVKQAILDPPATHYIPDDFLARTLRPLDAHYAEEKANVSAALGPYLLPRASQERELHYVNEEDRLWHGTFFFKKKKPSDWAA